MPTRTTAGSSPGFGQTITSTTAIRLAPPGDLTRPQVWLLCKRWWSARALVKRTKRRCTLALDLARSASIKHSLTSAIFSLEMSQIEITMRLLSAEASIPLSHIRGGKMSDDDWSRVATKMGQVSEAPMYIDDSPNLTMMEIRAKARRLKQRHDLKLVVIDYIQLMTSGKKVESRQLEVSEFSRQLKLLAKELQVPVVALSQLNRGPEQRTDKKPMLSDLRESGSLEQDADMVVLLHRPDLYDKESERAGEADFIVAKHRNGPTKDITVAFQAHYSRFTRCSSAV
jgi:replicative DNA helicase